jgi:hypothetical protein
MVLSTVLRRSILAGIGQVASTIKILGALSRAICRVAILLYGLLPFYADAAPTQLLTAQTIQPSFVGRAPASGKSHLHDFALVEELAEHRPTRSNGPDDASWTARSDDYRPPDAQRGDLAIAGDQARRSNCERTARPRAPPLAIG